MSLAEAFIPLAANTTPLAVPLTSSPIPSASSAEMPTVLPEPSAATPVEESVEQRYTERALETGDLRENPTKVTSSGMIPTRENPEITRPEIEPRRGKRQIPEKIRQPAASASTIPTCENPGSTPPGVEPCLPLWEASGLTTKTTVVPAKNKVNVVHDKLTQTQKMLKILTHQELFPTFEAERRRNSKDDAASSINRIRLERVSQKKSSDINKTPVKRCREREINIKASERVNVDVFTQNKRPETNYFLPRTGTDFSAVTAREVPRHDPGSQVVKPTARRPTPSATDRARRPAKNINTAHAPASPGTWHRRAETAAGLPLLWREMRGFIGREGASYWKGNELPASGIVESKAGSSAHEPREGREGATLKRQTCIQHVLRSRMRLVPRRASNLRAEARLSNAETLTLRHKGGVHPQEVTLLQVQITADGSSKATCLAATDSLPGE
ncbi:hypothetical protein PR048_006878 [Dryococelus australis]|uniref:Uncharacterized protein n=1 Tax=Dryococelus australis TaxID=614101 RepID=A0ABQ9IC83_9NEOP|nr:hypothetical protein PR048_006878 [Dryococelus australis]